MDKKLLKAIIALPAVIVLTACSEFPVSSTSPKVDSEVKKEAPKPAEPVAALSAFWEMYKPARQWAPDVLPLTVTANEVPGMKNEGGKAAMWTAVFVSPSKREARTIFYSVIEHGTTLRGVTVGGPQSWSGETPKSKPFATGEFITNSDVAYKTAAAKADAWLKKNPDKSKASMILASSAKVPNPTWYIMWGDNKSGYLAFVNATTGMLMNK